MSMRVAAAGRRAVGDDPREPAVIRAESCTTTSSPVWCRIAGLLDTAEWQRLVGWPETMPDDPPPSAPGPGDGSHEDDAPDRGAPDRGAPDRNAPDGSPDDHDHGALGRLVHPAEPTVERVASAVEAALDRAATRWAERPGARVRRLRRLARRPLRQLYEEHPEARRANPRERGTRSIPTDEIRGTAVGGGDQRGADFLPLKPFRSTNWAARWQRIRSAVDRLTVLPPIDVYRYGDGYWVIDGHNRVAAALYAGQVEVDASVTELIPPDGVAAEPPAEIASSLIGSLSVRAAGEGLPPGAPAEDLDRLPEVDPKTEPEPPG
jgi:hypothetical protein